MPKSTKPPPKKPNATDQMVADAVRNAKARRKSGQTSAEWRASYAASLKPREAENAPLSRTPFSGDTNRTKK